MTLSAMPETTWSPRWVIEAKPWTMARPRPNSDAGQQAEPGAAGDLRHGGGGEGRPQHLALERDVDHAARARRTGRPCAASTSGAASRIVLSSIKQELEGDLAQHQAGTAACRRGRANSASSCGRNMFSSAPANRITRPWITTTRSLLTRGISKASSVPPW